MRINLNRFPGGVHKALVISYDDGVRQDIRLTEIFNKYGVRGTFHINAGLLAAEPDGRKLTPSELRAVYSGHEISVHGFEHQALGMTPREKIISEVVRDREALEDITGAPVRGMSYAYGSYNDLAAETLRALGIEYCRTTKATGTFALPADPLRWDPTCHHKASLLELGGKFIAEKPRYTPLLMFVWGHSYEFDDNNNWELIEQFCALAGGREDIWYATAIEFTDYMNAVRGLRFSIRQDSVYNPASIPVWFSAGEEPVEVRGGETKQLTINN